MARASLGSMSTRLRLRITAPAERALKSGHPWLFAAGVREQSREGEAGEIAAVYDRRDRLLALGLYDPDSPLRLRVLSRGGESVGPELWAARLHGAQARRAGQLGADTDGYRLLSGESDGMPGLVLDRYGPAAVLKLYTAAWFPHLPDVLAAVGEALPGSGVVLRLSRNIAAQAAQAGLQDGQVLQGAVPERVVFRESGLRFWADVRRGQKTGFFLDQRENRRRVERLSHGRAVLNAFSFSGGFSLYAARGGAASVTSLDISPHALREAHENFALNPELLSPHTTVQADVFEYLREPGPDFDLVVLDPPSLARRAAEREGALRAYARLTRSGIARVRPGGALLSASCTAQVSAEAFVALVLAEAQASGRAFGVLEQTGHAPDHPAAFPEAHYLKAVYLQFEP